MINKNTILYICIYFSISSYALAQSTYQIGILPSFTFTKKINPRWKISLNTQARFSTYKGNFLDLDSFQKNFDYTLTDISILVNRKLGFNTSISLGYLSRYRNSEQHNRLFQQFIISKKHNSLGLAQRFSTDQTSRPNQKTEFRWRYRLGFDKPLKGSKLNSKEFYLKFNNEYIIALQDKEWTNEIRISPFLGYAFTDRNKVEIGIDYRVGSLGDKFLRNNIWSALNYYWSF